MKISEFFILVLIFLHATSGIAGVIYGISNNDVWAVFLSPIIPMYGWLAVFFG